MAGMQVLTQDQKMGQKRRKQNGYEETGKEEGRSEEARKKSAGEEDGPLLLLRFT
ncbi:MAG: hypothetical protein HZB82_05555 [Deltaproteobacteria bacterium]|nr:hypothetical protein [Deltaproteobacteria bacterium]